MVTSSAARENEWPSRMAWLPPPISPHEEKICSLTAAKHCGTSGVDRKGLQEELMDRKRRVDLGELDSPSKKGRAQPSGDDLSPWTGRPYSAKYYSILETRRKLPVYQFKDDLLKAVSENQIVVVEGETGSGTCTSTGLPCGSLPPT